MITESVHFERLEVAVSRQPIAVSLKPNRWHYPEDDGGRDLRVDFIRGVVLFILIVVHIELFSLYNFFVWERIGVVSGAEGFVILTGYVTGFVSRKRIDRREWKENDWKLIGRAFQLWKVNVAAIVLLGLLSRTPALHLPALTSFTDRAAHVTYQLFPAAGTPLDLWIYDAVLLRIGPHQLQVLGLYICLLPLAPLLLRAMAKGWTPLALALSWAVYGANWTLHLSLTGCQFENAFPLLTWQVLFVNGLAIGFHRRRVWKFMLGQHGRFVFWSASLVSLAFLFWAQNTPNPLVPGYARLSLIPAEVYRRIYDRFMQKNLLGPLRLLDYASVLIVGYGVLTRCWRPIHRWLGWFFIPLGQASLYVFILHIFIVALISTLFPFHLDSDPRSLAINTLLHTFALGSLWMLVRHQVLFRWIPR